MALLFFGETLTQWEHVADFGVLMRTSLRYSAVDDAAARHGYESPVPPHVLDRVRILEQWLLKLDRQRREGTAPPPETKRDDDDEESVN